MRGEQTVPDVPPASPTRIKLVAIAKDEGAYLADWVFHHLDAGFDAIEVWINQTSDPSLEIMERIARTYPQVSARVVDDLLSECLREGRNFQHRAYAALAVQAQAAGFTHAAYFDLDEYWLARDPGATIHDFLPADPDVVVVSFPWLLNRPDPSARPFAHPLAERMELTHDSHVKSVVRLDGPVVEMRTHTARISSGRRLLIRDKFPLEDERAQQWGSTVPSGHLATAAGAVPEAFLLHAVFRSQTEYVAGLAKGLRQLGKDVAFKDNRDGFVAAPGPVVTVERDRADYFHRRAEFLARTDVGALVEAAQGFVTQLHDRTMSRLRADPELVRRQARALQGVSDPALDRLQPGWAATVGLFVEHARREGNRLVVTGWAYASSGGDLTWTLRTRSAGEVEIDQLHRIERPDVVARHPAAPPAAGFHAEFDVTGVRPVRACVLRVADTDGAESTAELRSHLRASRLGS